MSLKIDITLKIELWRKNNCEHAYFDFLILLKNVFMSANNQSITIQQSKRMVSNKENVLHNRELGVALIVLLK